MQEMEEEKVEKLVTEKQKKVAEAGHEGGRGGTQRKTKEE